MIPTAFPTYLIVHHSEGGLNEAVEAFNKRFPWSGVPYKEVEIAREKTDRQSPSDYEDNTIVFSEKDSKYYFYINGKVDTRAATREKLLQLIKSKHGDVEIAMEITN